MSVREVDKRDFTEKRSFADKGVPKCNLGTRKNATQNNPSS
jgi:hypothetical protein